MVTFAHNFSWAYYDGFENTDIAQVGYGFTLVLLSKYGNQKRLDTFYAEKYFKAFPALETLERNPSRCYSIRSFDRFLDYFGLIRIESKDAIMQSIKHISKTDLFDKLINIVPPKSA